MRKQRKAVAIGCMVFLLGLCACKRETNGLLLDNVISGEEKTVAFVEYKKEDSVSYFTEVDTQGDALLEQLDRIKATPAEDWTSDLVTLPIYGVVVMQRYEEIEPYISYGYWSNGYWITPEGEDYEYDLPVEKIKEKYTWETNSFSSVTEARCIGALVTDENGWKKELLTEAKPAEQGPGLVTEVTVQDNVLTVTMENEGSEAWFIEKYDYVLEVLLDSEWYEIPLDVWARYDRGDMSWLPSGEDTEVKYSLSIYDELPAGKYRLITGYDEKREAVAEFELPVANR